MDTERICTNCGATLTAYGYCVICLKRVAEFCLKIDKKDEDMVEKLIQQQPKPIKNDGPAIWDLVIEEMKSRDKLGLERYGTRLQPFNGRDTLRDAFDEALDLCVYLRAAIFERDNK